LRAHATSFLSLGIGASRAAEALNTTAVDPERQRRRGERWLQTRRPFREDWSDHDAFGGRARRDRRPRTPLSNASA